MLTRSRPPPLLPTHQPSTKQQHQRTRTQHTSNNKNGCCFGMDRLTFGIVLVWIIFIVWCTLLYQYGFLAKNSSSSLNDNTIESVNNNNNNNKDNDDLYAKLFQLQQQQQQQQQQLNNPIINTNNNNDNNNNNNNDDDDKKTTTTTTTTTVTTNSNSNNKNGVIPIVVIAYQRANELKKCLDTLFRYKPDENDDQFHIYVSQDGYHEGVARVARSYGNRVTLFQRERKIQLPAVPVGNNPSYYALSQHYKFAVNQVFAQQTIRLPNVNYERIILLEEDLEVAPDFYSYFSALSPLLEQDSSLLCISAWNDNGMRGYVNDATRLYRSDFFPGLGWMITKQLWENELRDVWPLGYWDDWLREAGSRRGRNCIRPEINRTYTFGAKGTSGGQFGRYLDAIQLNDQNIDWKSIDVSYIRDKKRYDEELQQLVDRAEAVNPHQVRTLDKKDHVLKILYNSPHHYESISKQIGIFPELKAGVPRGAYHGVVSLKYKDNVVLLVPSSNRAEPMTYTNDPPYPPRPQ